MLVFAHDGLDRSHLNANLLTYVPRSIAMLLQVSPLYPSLDMSSTRLASETRSTKTTLKP
jgi:hypothetical protein